MKIEGSHTLAVPRAQVWRMLQDPAVLAKATPGVKKMEKAGEDRYKATLELGIGPVKGSFEGHLTITEKQEPEVMTLAIEGQGGPGGVRAQGRLRLEEQGNQTIIHYEGVPQISGKLAAVGMRLLSGVAKKMAGDFFSGIEKEASTYQ
jgi:uncharacterized protein